MYPYINFLGSKLPTYSICAMLGLLAATLVLITALYSMGLVRKYALQVYMALPAVILGSRLFSTISITLTGLYSGEHIDLVKNINQGGNVYYGGLLGYLTLLFLLCKLQNRDFGELGDSLAMSIPLFHSFGRIGCFFAGCCYGIKSDAWYAIKYKIGDDTTAARQIPVQLFEAGFELCLFGVLCVLFWRFKKRDAKTHCLLEIYFLAYCPFRFFNEFFRGDLIRGVYGFLSFSQIISLILLFGIACHHVYRMKIK